MDQRLIELCRKYKNDYNNLTLQERNELIDLLVDRFFNKSGFNTSDKDLLDALKDTDLIKILGDYLFDVESYWSDAKKRFMIRHIIQQAIDYERLPGYREEFTNTFFNNAIRAYNVHNQAGPSNYQPVSVEFDRRPKTSDHRSKRKLNEAFDAENEKRIKLIESKNFIEEIDCPICLSELKTGICMVNPCGHKFHCDCILSAMSHKKSCPMCRIGISELIRLDDKQDISDSETTDGTSGKEINEEPEVNSFGKRKRLSDLMYLMRLNTKLRKVGRRNGN